MMAGLSYQRCEQGDEAIEKIKAARQAQCPYARARGTPSGRNLYGAGAGRAAMLERKSGFLSQIWLILALRRPSFNPLLPL